MLRRACAVLCFLLPTVAFPQSDAPDTQQSLKAIADEIHLLREQLQMVSVLSERAQIALYRLQGQQLAVTSARQRVDSTRSRVSRIEADQRDISSKIQKDKEEQQQTKDASEQKYYDGAIAQLNSTLANLRQQQGEAQTVQSEAEADFRAEQDKLDNLQNLLDNLDKSLTALDSRRSPAQ
jgi:chromosome segregation ATPase